MAIGDKHLRVIEAGQSYTPAAGVKELITNINLHSLSDFEIKYAGQSKYIDFIDKSSQSPYTMQNPGFILTPNITIRQKVNILIIGLGTNLLSWSEDNPNQFVDLGNIDVHCENAEYERIDGITVYSNGDLLIKTVEPNIESGETRNLNLYRINPNNLQDVSGNYGPLVGSDTFILSSGSQHSGSVTFGPSGDIYVLTYGKIYRLNPTNIADETGTYRNEMRADDDLVRALIYNGVDFIGFRSKSVFKFSPSALRTTTSLGTVATVLLSEGLAYNSVTGNFYGLFTSRNVSRQSQIKLLNKDDVSDDTGIFGVKANFATADLPDAIIGRQTIGNSVTRYLNGFALIQASSGYPIRISTIEVP